MFPFNRFPGTNMHDLDLDWLLRKMRELWDKVKSLNNNIDEMYDKWDEWKIEQEPIISQTINEWLDNHPEATTTVQDWSLEYDKLVRGTLGYVTPEMYGAVGDGVTDDTAAVQEAIDTRLPVYLSNKYFLTDTLTITRENTIITGGNYGQLISEDRPILSIGNAETTMNNTYLFNVTFLCRNRAPAIRIEGFRVNKLYIYNCDFDMFKDYAIYVNCPTGYNYVEKCRFYTTEANTKYIHFGVSSGSIAINYWFIRNNAFEFGVIGDAGLDKDAVYIESGIVLEITNNDFANWNSGHCINITPSDTVNNIKIKDNLFYNIGNADCIYISRQLSEKAIYDISIEGNFFDSESRTGRCIFTTADAVYYITDVFLGVNKIKGSWINVYKINRISNLHISEFNLVDSDDSMPALSGLCTYDNYANYFLPTVKRFTTVTIPAGESAIVTMKIKNVPHTLQYYVPTIYNSHSTGSGVLITGSDFNDTTGEITVTLTSSASGPRYCIVSLI